MRCGSSFVDRISSAHGVYVKGVVIKIDERREHVTIRVKEYES